MGCKRWRYCLKNGWAPSEWAYARGKDHASCINRLSIFDKEPETIGVGFYPKNLAPI
jgi:hypothetical protein